MRAIYIRTAAVLVVCFAGAASAQPAVAQSAAQIAPIHQSISDEIVVTGRRDTGRYRLAPQFRTAPDAGDRWRRMLARDWSCHDVGPRGCGLQPNPLITVGADGTVQIGDPSAGK